MEMAHEHDGMGLVHEHHEPRTLPAVLTAPQAVGMWRTRAIVVAAIFGLLSLVFLLVPGGKEHLLRAYLMGYHDLLQLRRRKPGAVDGAVCVRR